MICSSSVATKTTYAFRAGIQSLKGLVLFDGLLIINFVAHLVQSFIVELTSVKAGFNERISSFSPLA